MAIALVVRTAVQGAAPTSSAINTTGATLLTVVIATDDGFGTAGVVSDNKGNTWTRIVRQDSTAFSQAELFYCQNPTVGSGHTVTYNENFTALEFDAWSGTATTSVLDSFSSSGGSSPRQPGSITPANAGSLFLTGVSGIWTLGSPTGDATFTPLSDTPVLSSPVSYALGAAYKVSSSAENPQWASPDTTGIAVTLAVFIPGGGSPDVTVALTGVAATGAVGSTIANHADPLTGVNGTGAAGDVGVQIGGNITVALTDVSGAGSVGTVGVSDSIPITGVSATSAVGTVGRDQLVTILLTGVSATGQVGDVGVTGDKSIALTGVQATGQVGNVGVSGVDTGAAPTRGGLPPTKKDRDRYLARERLLDEIRAERVRAKRLKNDELEQQLTQLFVQVPDVTEPAPAQPKPLKRSAKKQREAAQPAMDFQPILAKLAEIKIVLQKFEEDEDDIAALLLL